jgi:hypothetical protein
MMSRNILCKSLDTRGLIPPLTDFSRPGAGHADTFAESAIGGGPDIMGMWIIAYGEQQ